jgi:hypothetical protein
MAQLPELLAAMRRGENMVKLGDGSIGLLPQEWLKQYGLLAGLGGWLSATTFVWCFGSRPSPPLLPC